MLKYNIFCVGIAMCCLEGRGSVAFSDFILDLVILK